MRVYAVMCGLSLQHLGSPMVPFFPFLVQGSLSNQPQKGVFPGLPRYNICNETNEVLLTAWDVPPYTNSP